MGTVTNSIGTASRDFSTIALWEAALPANAVTAGNSYVGQCYNDSEFDLTSTILTIGGTTTDATHTITLTTGPGQSFRDNANAATNALRYNVSNGVGITGTVQYDNNVKVADNFVTFSNLQLRNTNAKPLGSTGISGTNFEADNCIFYSIVPGDGQVVDAQGASAVFTNCLIIADGTIALKGLWFESTGSAINCTIVKPSNIAASGTGIKTKYSANTIQNCAIAGFTTSIATVSGTFSGPGNAIDTGSYPTGLSGQVSLTIATEFVQPDNSGSAMDWRLNSTSVKCKDQGTNAGGTTTDIIGQAISNIIRDVGAWELQQGGATRGLFFNANLALGAGGSFFSDRLAL